MVALESLPMHGSVFPHFWLSCLDNPDGLYFINLLCSSCNFFKDYIYQLITQEREFLMDNQLFDFIRTCLPKVR